MKPNFKEFVFLHSSKYHLFQTATFLVRAPRINLRSVAIKLSDPVKIITLLYMVNPKIKSLATRLGFKETLSWVKSNSNRRTLFPITVMHFNLSTYCLT